MMPNCSQIGQISISALRHIPEQKETCLNMENQVQWWIKVSMTGVDMYRHVMGMSGTSHRLVFTNLRSWTACRGHGPLSITCVQDQDVSIVHDLLKTWPGHSIAYDLSKTYQRHPYCLLPCPRPGHLHCPWPVWDMSKTSLFSKTCPRHFKDISIVHNLSRFYPWPVQSKTCLRHTYTCYTYFDSSFHLTFHI